MLPGLASLPEGLGMRPAGPADQPFLASLYSSTRDDLRLIDGEKEFVDSIVDMQFRAQGIGYGHQYPNAMYFIVEKQRDRIGKVTLDFGPNAVHVVDIAFIPAARGKGYGKGVLQAIQMAAGMSKAPVVLSVAKDNYPARQLYTQLGFRLEEAGTMYDRLIWYPDVRAMRGS